jgi:hypothetical protein
MNQALVVMTKAPRAGAVKTRLCPPLDLEEAAALHHCFLLDTIEKIIAIKAVSPVISYAPASERTYFEALAPNVILLPQRGIELGARMADCFDQLFALGYPGVLLTGSDLPTLPQSVLQEALARLASPQVDMVLGPSEDGGYYLIGLRTLYRALFEAIPWSTPQVFDETVKRAEQLGLRVAHLPIWFDIDTPQDLARLQTVLRHGAGPMPWHTRQFLAHRVR